MATHPTRFENLHDLARLPWFSLKDGELVVDDPSVPTAIDMHTHLALTYVRSNRVDLHRRTARTERYLPDQRPIDFDVYINRNFSPEDLAALERDLGLGSLVDGGMRSTHTVANLARDMGALKISNSVLLAIDWPFGLSRNADTWLAATEGRSDMIVFGSVHPYDTQVEARLDAQKARGAKGIKVHPAVQMVKPDAARCMRFYKACGDRDLPILFHCGPVDIETRLGRYLSQVKHYERAIAENPRTRFVLGHSGALQMPEALEFAKKYPNCYLELSSQSLSGVKKILAEAPPDRPVFGTDWPFYSQAIGLAKVFIATDGDDALRHAALYGNAARILGLPEVPVSSVGA
ncbi:MAG: amidohydrolase family protein [Myxococcales bacterium]|nr:amidohydrolase family protein [Myxococcales bacterium]